MERAWSDFALDLGALLKRLGLYVAGIVTLALIVTDLLVRIQPGPTARAAMVPAPPPAPRWVEMTRAPPAFALPLPEPEARLESAMVFRREGGGRKDVLRWTTGEGGPPLAEITILRRPADLSVPPPTPMSPATDIMAAKFGDAAAAEAAGVLGSKFGALTLARFTLPQTGSPCLGFAAGYAIDDDGAAMQLSGFACPSGPGPVKPEQIACMIDRLTLLSAGHDHGFAEWFAQAERRRTGCKPAVPLIGLPAAEDWIMTPRAPTIRGALSQG